MRRYFVLGIAGILFALLPFITSAQSDGATDGGTVAKADKTPSPWSELRKFSRARVVIRREKDAERRVVGIGTFQEFTQSRTSAVTGAGQGQTESVKFQFSKSKEGPGGANEEKP